ncbi:BASS family bile acid:Na+ symporter [Salsuginibacillus halophilus]|uniref:BASS family bile acid:Na+ symporter n=1 Tax=Salsuginibacillus halophilus TaxID=517424 RepID=A0A2P8HBE5_9BACI|nr:bile acid:sodium symporter family protein [Salsuginibacillus halophilus]PSL43543.1 BASS family bile acid:Na+ symporter [Salsuginibacillus halophilus]
MNQIGQIIRKYFAVLVIVVSIVALVQPNAFIWIAPYINLLLGVVMFGMGLTMRPVDFQAVAKKPLPVFIGLAAQFVIMPLAAFVIAYALQLPPALAAGLVLVGACPGGTASNVMVYLSRGDVAVSVAMTSVSTLLAPLLTPAAFLLLAGQWLPVSAGDMVVSILQVIIVPIVLGVLVRRTFPDAVERSVAALPVVSVAAILAIIAAILGLNQEEVLTGSALVFAAVILHNTFGLLLGYLTAVFTGLDRTKRRAISLEVGMQNSGLAAGLATAHLNPLAALPSAIFSVWHNISGTALVSLWNRDRKSKEGEGLENEHPPNS